MVVSLFPPSLMPTALASLALDIARLSLDDRDLVEENYASAKKWCFKSHCERVWLKLSPEQRGAIRDLVREEGAVGFENALYVDFRCIEEIGRIIGEVDCYPLRSIAPTDSAMRE